MKLYIDVETLQKQTLLSARECRKVIQLVRSELVEKGELIISDRPRLVPTEYVLRKLNLKASQIRQQARAMRGESRG